MAHDPHHEHLVKELAEILEPVLSGSPQAIYIYLDDEHKICNKKYADMLGYESAGEWEEEEYSLGDVVEKDQDKLVKAYTEASQNFKATTLNISFQKKDGKKIKSEVIMAPISYKDEVFVIHFISASN